VKENVLLGGVTMYASGPARWQPHKYILDPVRSVVEVRIGDIVAAVPVVGGTLTSLRDSWRGAWICVMVDVADVHAGDPDTNALLRSEKILDAANYPHAVFRGHIAPDIAGQWNDDMEISGALSFRGAELPLTFAAQYVGERAGAHRFAARAVLRRPPCRIGARVNIGNFNGNAAVEVIIHTEWMASEDPLPAA
jgi:polyisoprenoid-binding protein YceI